MTRTIAGPQVLKIKDPSAETIAKMFATLKQPIIYSENVWFVAHDDMIPREAQDLDKYMARCREKRVMPFTQAFLKYSSDEKIFEADRNKSSVCAGFPEKYRSEVIKSLINGGKFYRLGFEFGEFGRSSAGFEEFRTRLLPTLTDQGYAPEQGTLWFTNYHSTGYDGGDEMADGLSFVRSNLYAAEKGLGLRIGHKVTPQQTQDLRDWFQSLKHD